MVSVITELPLPATDGGLKVAVTPVGRLLALNTTGGLNPSAAAITTVAVTAPILGGARVWVVVGAIVKLARFTIKVRGVECVIVFDPTRLCPVIERL